MTFDLESFEEWCAAGRISFPDLYTSLTVDANGCSLVGPLRVADSVGADLFSRYPRAVEKLLGVPLVDFIEREDYGRERSLLVQLAIANAALFTYFVRPTQYGRLVTLMLACGFLLHAAADFVRRQLPRSFVAAFIERAIAGGRTLPSDYLFSDRYWKRSGSFLNVLSAKELKPILLAAVKRTPQAALEHCSSIMKRLGKELASEVLAAAIDAASGEEMARTHDLMALSLDLQFRYLAVLDRSEQINNLEWLLRLWSAAEERRERELLERVLGRYQNVVVLCQMCAELEEKKWAPAAATAYCARVAETRGYLIGEARRMDEGSSVRFEVRTSDGTVYVHDPLAHVPDGFRDRDIVMFNRRARVLQAPRNGAPYFHVKFNLVMRRLN